MYEKNIVGYVHYLGKNVYFDKDGIVVESSDQEIEGVPLIKGLTFDRAHHASGTECKRCVYIWDNP